MGLTRLAVRRPLTILMAILGVVLMGGVSYTYLRVDRLPPIDVPFIGVNVSYPGASAQDVEQLVAEPVENALSGMPGVQQISSNSSEGRVNVTLQLANGTNVDAAAIDAGRRVQSIQRSLPAQATAPTVFKADPNASPILNIALSGAPLDQLFDLANTELQPQLQSVPGVAQVNLSGGRAREVQVTVDYSRLAGYGLTVTQLSQAIAAANVTAPIGTIDQGPRTLTLRSTGNIGRIADLANIVVTQTPTGPILLRDVATVAENFKRVTQLQRINGTDAVGLSVVKQSDANELRVATDVKAALEGLRKVLPAESKLEITSDNSLYTRASLDAIQRDLVIAVVLVGVVMILFLHQWRNTAIVLFAVPTVLVSTFLFMYALGFTLNIMTLMAIALMIGILVDDSIVVLENIHRHFTLGESAVEAALNGRSEIGLAAIAITMADVIVYAPMAFVSGTVGQLFRQYGLTIVIATLLSLLVSFTLTPMVASRWLKRDAPASSGWWATFSVWWDREFDRLGRLFGRAIPWTLRWRWFVALGLLGLIVACGAMIKLGVVGTEYAPAEDNSNLQVNLTMPAATSLDATDAAARTLEDAIRQLPGVVSVFSTVSSGGGFGGGGGSANLLVDLVPKQERTATVFDIAQQVRDLGRQVPGATVNASVSSPLGGGAGTNGVQVLVQGTDLDTLNQVAAQVQAAAATVQGLTRLQNTGTAAVPELQIVPDNARMAQLGVTAQQVANVMAVNITGSVVSQFRAPGRDQEDITLIADPTTRSDVRNLLSAPVAPAPNTTTAGAAARTGVVTLGQVAAIRNGTGPVQIQRVNRNRTITLRGQATGRPLGPVAADLRAQIAQLSLPAGFAVTLGGQVQALDQAVAALTQALILAIVLEYMLLVALYQSWFYPLVRMLAVPLGLFGALVGLWATGNTLNIFSIIGLVMAEGLVAKSSILLIDYTNSLREQGVARTEALVEAARTRLRPILMTSATMVFGMLPLALKLEAGAESRAPIAIVVMGGLISSTFLTLLVVPAIYSLFDDLSEWSNRGRRGGGAIAVVGEGPTEVAAAAPATGIREPAWRG